ncbi:MAG: hypothetical protein JWQ95_6159 [Sphaerisporangium sp.]|nr:hypothetical protein [Sphaerisporangium sp.]
MSIDKDTTRDIGGGQTATAVGERPAVPAARRAAAPPRPQKTPRRATPAPRRVTPATSTPPVAEGSRRASSARTAPRTPFVLLVVGLLCGGLVSLLLLNTVLAQDSFRMSDLLHSTQRLRQEAQDKSKELLIKSQPGEIARRAKEQGDKPDATAPDILVIPSEEQGAGRQASQAQTPVGSQAEVATR